jgi:hypothetical protein
MTIDIAEALPEAEAWMYEPHDVKGRADECDQMKGDEAEDEYADELREALHNSLLVGSHRAPAFALRSGVTATW